MERIKDLKIKGIADSFGTRTDLNPTGQSAVIDFGDHVLIARPLDGVFTNLSSKEETKRRVQAMEAYKKELGQLVLPNEVAIFEGNITNANGQTHEVEVFARLTPKVHNVLDSKILGRKKVADDKTFCLNKIKMNIASLKLLLTKGIILDTTIMTGVNKNGERIYFCDPDWYDDLKTNPEIKFYRFVYHFGYNLGGLVYFLFSYIKGSVTEKISSMKIKDLTAKLPQGSNFYES